MATCTKCGKDNRAEAKYCRFCGEKFEVQISETSLIGKQSIEPELEKLEQKLKVAKILAQGGTRIDLDCLILGDAGSGKHFIAKTIASKIIASGVAKQGIKEVDAADWDQFSSDFDKNISSLKDGILLITNAQKLLPTSKSSDVNQLDKLFARMRTVEGAPIVLLCGHMNDLSGFLENNKDVRRLFGFEFRLEPFSNSDLCILTSSMLREKYKLGMEDGAVRKLKSHFAWCMRQKEMGYVNGHLAEKTAEDLAVKAAMRSGKSICETDIDDSRCFTPKTEEEILSELDKFVGLQSVKDEIKAIIRNVKKKKENGITGKLLRDHYIFTGNPGTGKTTFARKFGEVLNAIGALPTGQFVEISGKDFIGQFQGDTEANVKKYVDKAMGGILFIDEAYALAGGDQRGGYGTDAVNTLLNIAENRKGEFVCIMAGYTKEMGEFIRINPGTTSRFNVTIEFPDYKPRELEEIFRRLLSRNNENTTFTLDAKADEMLPGIFDKMYLKRTDTFGNAREVRNLFDEAVKRHNTRNAEDNVLSWNDIAGEEGTKEISVEDVMKELDAFVGMGSVKKEIRTIANDIAVQRRLVEMGEAEEGLSPYNIIITGNPGTGKSTVAKTLGKIFKALGVTSTDNVVTKMPNDIISKYVNESDKNMDAAINEAMGGVLFLDEAYDLEPMDSAGQSTSSEGKKAIRTLMNRMLDDAGKFVVICAGYRKQMETMLNSNPGLKSRFSHTIHIEDYTAEELLQIYENAAKAKKYNFSLADESVRMKALNMFQNMVAMKDDKFGNAREAVTKVKQTKTNINNRISATPYEKWTPEFLHTAYLDDIPFEEAAKVSVEDCLAELNALIGLEGVKTALTKLAHTINNEIELAKAENRTPVIPLGHYLFLGNPGTGKTTVARLMGKILHSMGALPSPKVVEVVKHNLVGRYLGDTEAVTTNVINSAMGGILFIDEAYQLAMDQYGKTALQTLVDRLENDRGKFVCIAAGYSHEMQEFISENSGFESRFPQRNRIVFEDYNPDELFRIFMIHARKGGYSLDPMAENAVRGRLTVLYNNRGRSFGNGRDARNLFDEVKGNLAARLAEEGETVSPEERKLIKMEDVL